MDATSTPDQHDPDWPKYPETVLQFSTSPPIEIDLRRPVIPEAIAQLRKMGLDSPFAIMTAYDPRGQDLSADENETRRKKLNDRLSANGYRFVQVDCCSPDLAHCECSVAVAMPQDAALDLARELEQVAIFWFDGERFWILGAIVDTDALALPRSS